jgi:hypothetical protein
MCHPEKRSDEGSQNGKAIQRSEIVRFQLRMTFFFWKSALTHRYTAVGRAFTNKNLPKRDCFPEGFKSVSFQ